MRSGPWRCAWHLSQSLTLTWSYRRCLRWRPRDPNDHSGLFIEEDASIQNILGFSYLGSLDGGNTLWGSMKRHTQFALFLLHYMFYALFALALLGTHYMFLRTNLTTNERKFNTLKVVFFFFLELGGHCQSFYFGQDSFYRIVRPNSVPIFQTFLHNRNKRPG